MKRPSRLASLLLCFGTTAFAQTPKPAVVTLNFSQAVLATAEAQRDLAALEKKFAPREQQLRRLNDELEADKKQLGDSLTKWSENEKAQRTQALVNKDKQLQRDSEDFKTDSQNESQQVFQRVAQKLFAFLQDYAKQHAYSTVLDRGSEATPIVWYAAPDIDITRQLVAQFDLYAAKALPEAPTK